MPRPVRWFNENWPVWVSSLLLTLLGMMVTLSFRAGALVNTVETVKAAQHEQGHKIDGIEKGVNRLTGAIEAMTRQKVADAEPAHRAD